MKNSTTTTTTTKNKNMHTHKKNIALLIPVEYKFA